MNEGPSIAPQSKKSAPLFAQIFLARPLLPFSFASTLIRVYKIIGDAAFTLPIKKRSQDRVGSGQTSARFESQVVTSQRFLFVFRVSKGLLGHVVRRLALEHQGFRRGAPQW